MTKQGGRPGGSTNPGLFLSRSIQDPEGRVAKQVAVLFVTLGVMAMVIALYLYSEASHSLY